MGKWKEIKLKDVIQVINGRAYKKPELLSEGKYRVLRVGNLFTNNSWYFSNIELPEDKYCEKCDLIYAWSASFGPRIWDGDKVIYHYHIWKIEWRNRRHHTEWFAFNAALHPFTHFLHFVGDNLGQRGSKLAEFHAFLHFCF